MSVAFSELYPLIRAVVGDNDADFRTYEDDVLSSYLTLLSLEHSYWRLEENDSEAFQDLSNLEKARIILYCARGILAPAAGSFSYRTPILSVARSGGPSTTLAEIDRRIANLDAKRLIAYDADIWALLDLGLPRITYSEYLPGTGTGIH